MRSLRIGSVHGHRSFHVTSTVARRIVLSRVYAPGLREVPREANAHVASHRLMLQTGMMRRVASGVFAHLPLGIRALARIEALITDEMESVGAQRISLPILQPSDLWKATGRWDRVGKEQFRLQDRKDAECCLAPTAEEVVTQLLATDITSFRELPLRLFQIGPKFRDELRPRLGLLRGREFLMKDMYSFDKTEEDALKTYEEVVMAYRRIFDRLGLPYVVVEADSGSIGGDLSHEVHILSDVGEDLLLMCDGCGYAANVEKAVSLPPRDRPPCVFTPPEPHHILETSQPFFFSVVRIGIDTHAVVLLPHTRALSATKVKSALGENEAIVLSERSVSSIVHGVDRRHLVVCVDAWLHPETLSQKEGSTTIPAWAMDLGRAWNADRVLCDDFGVSKHGDTCRRCKDHALAEFRGIEVGHTFHLGSMYSNPLGARYRSASGCDLPIEMGCYGIGVSRMLAAIVQVSHDPSGLVWPEVVAPFHTVVIPVAGKEDADPFMRWAEDVCDQLEHEDCLRGRVALDDRNKSTAFKLRDARFMGYPYAVLVGRGMRSSTPHVEIQARRTGDVVMAHADQVGKTLRSLHDRTSQG